jgi:diguanylate cyclase (GGDEF)-like protein/PAS domain S-box-containing protein
MSTKLPPIGQERTQVYQRLLQKCLSNDELSGRTKEILQRIYRGLTGGEIEYYGSQEDSATNGGIERILTWHNALLRDEAGVVLATLSTAEDITERKRVDQRLKEDEERFRHVFEDGPLGMVMSDEDFCSLQGNAAFCQMIGYEEAELLQMSLHDLWPGSIQEISQYAQKLHLGGQVKFEPELLTKDGHRISVEINARSFQLAGIPVIFSVVQDIRERKVMERNLLAASLRDELTGLYNRRGLLTLAEQQLKLAARLPVSLVLIFMDFDSLKGINDRYGHSEGDRALQVTTDILRRTFRESDILSRIGGDEFVVLAHISPSMTVTRLLERLENELEKENQRERRLYRLSFSIGFAEVSTAGMHAIDEALAVADARMYQHKHAKKRNSS